MRGLLTRDRLRYLLSRFRQLELLDRSYQLAAQFFVALIPLTLAVTAIVTDSDSAIAKDVIRRGHLSDTAAEVVISLFRSDAGQVYWWGLALVRFSVFSLARRVARAYSLIWQTPQLPASQLWRAAAWIALTIISFWLLTDPRRPAQLGSGSCGSERRRHDRGVVRGVVRGVADQSLAADARPSALHRIALAASLTALGHLGFAIWAYFYLIMSLSRQAEMYGGWESSSPCSPAS
ncbi:MAG: hypothetical protein ACOYEV_11600 [Candidatus Nanopelagicales bacterium]